MFRRHWLNSLPALILPLAAAAALLAGCATIDPLGAPVVGEYLARSVAQPRAALIRAAADQIGTPYRYGGNSRRGFDCSGLVQYAHRRIGVDVPRTTREQWSVSQRPQRRHLMPGDLVFFSLDGGKGRHVGIYEGRGLFIHAPSSGKRVSRASLDNPYWRTRLVGTRTFL